MITLSVLLVFFVFFFILFLLWWCCHVKGPAEPQLVPQPSQLEGSSIVIGTDVPGYNAAVSAPSWRCAGGCPLHHGRRPPPHLLLPLLGMKYSPPEVIHNTKESQKRVNPRNWAEQQQCYQRSHFTYLMHQQLSGTASLFFLCRNCDAE